MTAPDESTPPATEPADPGRDPSQGPPDLRPPTETPPIVVVLERLETEVPPVTIHELWIFPPRRTAGTETGVLVLAIESPDDHRFRVLTTTYTASRDKRGRLTVHHVTVEHGAADADRLQRVMQGVVRRVDESLPTLPPRAEHIGGDRDRWLATLASLRALPVRVAPGRLRN